jgi:EmrB/QacA subfamily drug resistance transporter
MTELMTPERESTVASRPVGRPTRDGGGGRHPGLALAILVTCQLMIALDSTVVTIALPAIQGSLQFSPTDLSWVLNAYTLALGGLLLLGGRAGDILGRRRVFIAGIALFTLASLLGGFATSAEWLLVTRAAQGVGAALAAPSVLALIATTFPEGPARNRALGYIAAAASSGGSIGLIAGGMLTAWVSWRWVLFINVPIGIAVVLLASRFIQESERRPGRFDLAGALTSTAGVTALVYGFIRAASAGWDDPGTLGAVVVAVVFLALFLVVETRAAQPIVPLRLFANRNRASAYVDMMLVPATLFGMFFFLTQFLQQVMGFSPITAGLAFLPLTIAIFTASWTVPRVFLPRFGAKPVLVAGATLIAGAMAWVTQISAGSSYVPDLLGPLVLFGLGAGCTFMPLTMTVLAGVPRQDTGAASGLLQTMQQVGGSLGVAILVTVFGTAIRNAAGYPLPNAAPPVQAHYLLAVGITHAFNVGAVFAACALLVVLLAIRGAPSNPSSQPVVQE